MDSDFQTHVAESLGRIEQKVTSLDDRLFGESGELPAIRKHIEWTETKQWLHSAVIIPVVASLNALLRHFTRP
jgi:hypothetical protein